MSRLVVTAALLCLSCGQTAAAAKTLQVDNSSCSDRVSFDPKAQNEARVKDSAELLYKDYVADHFSDEPHIATSADRAKADLDAYADACDRQVKALDALRLLNVPGLEDLRAARRTMVIDRCHLVSAEVRAAKGDLDALAAYAPARSACAKDIEVLRSSLVDFPSVWRRFVAKQCRNNSTPDCAGKKLADADDPTKIPDLRVEMLEAGWYNCANHQSYLNQGGEVVSSKGDTSIQTEFDRLKDQVAKAFAKRFKVVEDCDQVD